MHYRVAGTGPGGGLAADRGPGVWPGSAKPPRPVRGHRGRQRTQPARATWWCARPGSMPGDLHKLWRARDPKGYHVEYGYSCMAMRSPGGLGVKLAEPRARGLRPGGGRVVPDDGHRTGHTRLAEGIKDHRRPGAETMGSPRSAACRRPWACSGSAPATGTGTRGPAGWTATSCRWTWPRTRRAWGVRVLRVETIAELRSALAQAKDEPGPVLVPHRDRPDDPRAGQRGVVGRPVAEVSALEEHPPRPRSLRESQDRPAPPRRPRRPVNVNLVPIDGASSSHSRPVDPKDGRVQRPR